MTFLMIFGEPNDFADAYVLFRWALTAVGVGLTLIGLLMYFYRPKEDAPQSSPAAKLTALVSFTLIGVATIVYSWIWFGY